MTSYFCVKFFSNVRFFMKRCCKELGRSITWVRIINSFDFRKAEFTSKWVELKKSYINLNFDQWSMQGGRELRTTPLMSGLVWLRRGRRGLIANELINKFLKRILDTHKA